MLRSNKSRGRTRVNRVAQLSAAERLDLFQETATRRGVSAAVIEKDFWVCWALRQLFADADLRTMYRTRFLGHTFALRGMA